MSGVHRACRSESFGVRRWLQVGAASAGMSAALFGLSLAGPQVGIALADDSGPSQSDSSPSGASPSGSGSSDSSAEDPDTGAVTQVTSPSHTSTPNASGVTRPKTTVGSGRSPGDSDSEESSDAPEAEPVKTDPGDADTVDTDPVEAEPTGTDPVETEPTETEPTETEPTETEPTLTVPVESRDTVDSTPKSSASTHSDAIVAASTAATITTVADTDADALVAEVEPTVLETPADPGADLVIAAADPGLPWALQVGVTENPRTQFITQSITAWTTDSLAWIDSLPAPEWLKVHMEGALWTVRRGFLNLAPSVSPIQLTGQSSDPITGRVNAVDAEGDWIVYRVVQGPTSGSLQVNADGTFTYTPGADFNGVDSFVIMAEDLGLHVNLLDVFRGAGTAAGTLVNQGAIKFEFNYTTGAQYWTPDRRAALNRAASAAAAYLMVNAPVILTYDVTGEDDPSSATLAAAASDLVSTSPGFFYTVVQNKLINGVDSNGAEADGEIDWNFDGDWGLGDVISDDEYDFKAVAMHELMHSFGFTSRVRQVNTRQHWPVFSSFIVTNGGQKPIGADFTWDTAYDDYLTGVNGGFYFGGANAVAVYGGLVPLFTPNPYESGSSMAHLDDATFTGANEKMMNAKTGKGLSVRVLSPVELAILKDLGFTVVVPQQASPAPPATISV